MSYKHFLTISMFNRPILKNMTLFSRSMLVVLSLDRVYRLCKKNHRRTLSETEFTYTCTISNSYRMPAELCTDRTGARDALLRRRKKQRRKTAAEMDRRHQRRPENMTADMRQAIYGRQRRRRIVESSSSNATWQQRKKKNWSGSDLRSPTSAAENGAAIWRIQRTLSSSPIL